MALPGDRLVVSVGDAMGHDLTAASVMSRVRSTIRAYAVEGHSPGEALARTDLLLREVEMLHMTTALQATYERTTRRLDMARAGHPPALLLQPDGTTRWMEEIPAGPPLGTGLELEFETASVQLEPGETVILLTDGLIERRHSSLTDGMRQLEEVARRGVGLSAEALCDHLLADLTDGARVADDIAVLVLHIT